MSKLETKGDSDWRYFKHGEEIYRVTYWEMATQEDWDAVVE